MHLSAGSKAEILLLCGAKPKNPMLAAAADFSVAHTKKPALRRAS
jgi:hypothetical protein